MKNENLIAVEAIAAKTTAPASFKCPENCMMADTCGDCCMLSPSGQCQKYFHYTEPSHWACPWYYEN